MTYRKKVEEEIEATLKKAKEFIRREKEGDWVPPSEPEGAIHIHNIPDSIAWDKVSRRIKTKIDYD